MSAKKVIASGAVIVGCLLVAAGVVWAGGRDGQALWGLPILGWCAALAFVVQWIAFVPAFARQTERFYDLTGSVTYVTLTLFALFGAGAGDPRSWILASLVTVWAARLGTFLFRRVLADGSDARFDDIKPSAPRFLVAWTLQGLWVFLTLSAALIAITSVDPAPLGARDALGVSIWLAGFAIEVVADRQKRSFRASSPGHFVDTGLWAWSRHPNYFGEIVLWTGVALSASSTFSGWQWVGVISPLFVAFLLTRVSGIPILERRADERWGDDPRYQRYKARTPVLIPRPPRARP